MISFKPVSKRNPLNPEAPLSYHACVLSAGSVDLRGIAEAVADRCTLTTVDTLAVLEALLTQIPKELASGKIVNLGEFGTFSVSLRSKGAESAEEVSKFLITETKIHFRQGSEFRKKFKNLEFSKLAG